MRTGSPWCALSEKYGSWHTVYNNFRKWLQEEIIEKIFNYFCANAKKASQIQIDSTYVKVHQHSARAKKTETGEGIGKSRGGFTGRIYAVTEENGKIICILITIRNVHNSTQAENLLESIMHKDSYIIGDRAYNSDVVIPSRRNRKNKTEYSRFIKIVIK